MGEHPARRESRREQAKREAMAKIAKAVERGELVVRQASEEELQAIFGRPSNGDGADRAH